MQKSLRFIPSLTIRDSSSKCYRTGFRKKKKKRKSLVTAGGLEKERGEKKGEDMRERKISKIPENHNLPIQPPHLSQ